MKIEEGPAFGASIIGVGVGYLTFTKTGSLLSALALGAVIAVADYFLILLVRKIFPKSRG